MHNYLKDKLEKVVGGVYTEDGQIAFSINVAQQVLSAIFSEQWILLGGDILSLQLEYTYDSWYYNPNYNIPLSDNIRQSVETAEQYLANYKKYHKEEFFFVPVISNNYISAN